MKRRSAIMIAATACAVEAAQAGPHFVFQKVADTTDAPPQHSDQRFTSFDARSICLDGDQVAIRASFRGVSGGPSSSGVYVWNDGSLTKVIESREPVPDRPGEVFFNIGYASMSDGLVAFNGVAAGSGVQGVYAWRDGVLEKVLDTETVLEGDGRTALGFDLPPRVEGARVVTSALLSDGSGALILGSGSGPASVLVDQSTHVPGLDAPLQFALPGGFSAGRVVFSAGPPPPGSFSAGIYTVDLNGEVDVVADTTTLIPGTSAPFQTFFDLPLPSISGDTVTFDAAGTVANNEARGGVYGVDLTTGDAFTIADTTTSYPTVPGDDLAFAVSSSVYGDDTAFIAVGGSSLFSALLLRSGDELIPVIAENQTLFGREVAFLAISPESLGDGSIVFYASFTDGASGVYVATLVPAPSAAFCGVFAFTSRRRRGG